MSETKNAPGSGSRALKKISTAFTRALGVRSKRKAELFIDLSRAATLKDIVYWLQIFFSAGIATLGLVLNSPAVIIGAMLISPLMNPILSSGLALASGNLVLGLRAAFNLFLSCAAAIGFAVLLVVVLPFREMTAEIAARTQPNVLDLLIALFSGAVGSVAICREVKGVVTSIPGVAIAVALMPPLCVVGYGAGLMMVFDAETGWRVASGGGLLFLTNLVAITLTAMLVFMALRIDTPYVRERVQAWEGKDAESDFVCGVLKRFPRLEHAGQIHSLSLRLAMILLPLALILYPLGSAFSQLKNEIARKQRESQMRQTVTDVWQQNFQKKTDGGLRSTIDQLTVAEEKDGEININLRVFDDEPYTLAEKKRCARLLAERLSRPIEQINLRLTEIPTTTILEALRERDDKQPVAPPTFAELQAGLLQEVDGAMSDIELPPEARLLSRQFVFADGVNPMRLKMIYLSETNLAPDVQTAIVEKIRANLKDNRANVVWERIPAAAGTVEFRRNSATLPLDGMIQLDFAGRVMRENPSLFLSIAVQPQTNERRELADERMRAIAEYLETRWQITGDKIKLSEAAPAKEKVWLGFQAAAPEKEDEETESKIQAAK